jgi:hypothetical protein
MLDRTLEAFFHGDWNILQPNEQLIGNSPWRPSSAGFRRSSVVETGSKIEKLRKGTPDRPLGFAGTRR